MFLSACQTSARADVGDVRALTAMAIAIPDSVTVSMGEDTRGVFKEICLVRADVRSCEKRDPKSIQCHGCFNITTV